MQPRSIKIKQQCVEVYREVQNLKIAGQRLGIPWQTVYVYLTELGEPVCGNKHRDGSETDKFAAQIENYFNSLVPGAEALNRRKFQAKTDFRYRGYLIDVKASNPIKKNSKTLAKSWAFGSKAQQYIADFLVCFACVSGTPKHIFLVPTEYFRDKQTITIPESGKGKWWEFLISEQDLSSFCETPRPKGRSFLAESGHKHLARPPSLRNIIGHSGKPRLTRPPLPNDAVSRAVEKSGVSSMLLGFPVRGRIPDNLTLGIRQLANVLQTRQFVSNALRSVLEKSSAGCCSPRTKYTSSTDRKNHSGFPIWTFALDSALEGRRMTLNLFSLCQSSRRHWLSS